MECKLNYVVQHLLLYLYMQFATIYIHVPVCVQLAHKLGGQGMGES